MGQYHLTVNLSKRQFLDPHKLGDGLKLWEQAASAGGVGSALLLLLACSNGRGGGDFDGDDPQKLIGSWAGDRIALVGDYAERSDLGNDGWTDEADHIYTRCRTGQGRDLGADDPGGPLYTDISEQIAPLVASFLGLTLSGDGWRKRSEIGSAWARGGASPTPATPAMMPDMVFMVSTEDSDEH